MDCSSSADSVLLVTRSNGRDRLPPVTVTSSRKFSPKPHAIQRKPHNLLPSPASAVQYVDTQPRITGQATNSGTDGAIPIPFGRMRVDFGSGQTVRRSTMARQVRAAGVESDARAAPQTVD